jgi:very-long-chain (3R)-3-hydroxyacyl-CoA dehydratase
MLRSYLKYYNLTSCCLWLAFTIGYWFNLFPEIYSWIWPLTIVQGLAIFDVVHALAGWVKTSVFTTVIQYMSRMFVTGILALAMFWWPLSDNLLVLIGSKVIMLAWPLSEIIRYWYYFGKKGALITRLRYSAFIVLYPSGVLAEWLVMGKTLYFSILTGGYVVSGLIILSLVMYILYFPKLYGYLWQQRNKKLIS